MIPQNPAPAAPQVPARGVPVVDLGTPRAQAADLGALRRQRDILSDQLQNVRGRRDDIAQQLRNALPGADKTGLEGQLAQLDARVNTIESDLERTRQQLVDAVGQETSPPPGFNRSGGPDMGAGQVTAIMIVFTLFVLFPISISLARRLWKGAPTPKTPKTNDDSTERLVRLEQAVDTIAIEVERISEGQRFVTKILTERPGQTAHQSPAPVGVDVPNAVPEVRALGPGSAPAESIEVEDREAVRLRAERSA